MSTTNVNNPWRVTPQICADLRTLLVQLHNAYLHGDQRASARLTSVLGDAVADLQTRLEVDPNPQYYDVAQAIVKRLCQLARTKHVHRFVTGPQIQLAQAALSQLRRLESLLD